MVDNSELTTISELTPLAIYTVRVQAFTSMGAGPMSNPVKVKTQQGELFESNFTEWNNNTILVLSLIWAILGTNVMNMQFYNILYAQVMCTNKYIEMQPNFTIITIYHHNNTNNAISRFIVLSPPLSLPLSPHSLNTWCTHHGICRCSLAAEQFSCNGHRWNRCRIAMVETNSFQWKYSSLRTILEWYICKWSASQVSVFCSFYPPFIRFFCTVFTCGNIDPRCFEQQPKSLGIFWYFQRLFPHLDSKNKQFSPIKFTSIFSLIF